MTEVGIEQHLDQILKADPKNWRSYKRHLANFIESKDETEDFTFDEGDCYIRFKVRSDNLVMNKLFQVYELGELFPNIEWRRIIRTGMSSVLLQKPAAFLPAYAFALDRSLTLLYWGQQQAFFDPNRLKSLKLRNMLFTVHHPSNFVFSAANLAWPKSVENILVGSAMLGEMARKYLFNSLFAPQIGGSEIVWSESPYLIIGDRNVNLYSVHKSICHLAKPLRPVGRYELASVDILNNHLLNSHATCLISNTLFRELKQGEIFEALLTKHVEFTDSGAQESRIVLFPFQSSDLFGSDAHGILFTVMSLILRELYLKSPNSSLTNINLADIKAKVGSVFRLYPFSKFEWGDVGSRIISSDDGLKMLISLLGTYDARGTDVRFLHPSLLEIMMSMFRDLDRLNANVFKSILIFLSDVLSPMTTSPRVDLYYKFDIQKQIEKISKIRLDLRSVSNLLESLSAAARSFIPLSKSLNRPELDPNSVSEVVDRKI